ncbi:aspartate aminotransferase family protein [Candidatus Villigracilis affinis]|uniref:pyridoxal phosphate-dependent decarboxylase family protein n=2 Tax=Candidatus Villigracilis affinis TaxID=3140682 RepID=UPI002A1D0E0A|nr:aspartate aminotransferase family protein [Anaerolineales bacterium]
MPTLSLPKSGKTKADILVSMRRARDKDAQWQNGKVFGLVYHISEEIDDLLKEAYTMFFSENGLNPTAFPSLSKFENEIIAMASNLLGGDDKVAGTMTSGGTESLLMAVKTARDYARAKRGITNPEIILPSTAHPALDKAGEYFNVSMIHIPVRDDFRADVEATRRAITPNTIMLVGSAPSYPHGVVDPIRELAALAQEHGLLFHTDACVGGFMLPFVRKLGYPVPDFDFNVPGVTSISADLHKYAYAAKPASLVLYRTSELRRHQMFVSTDWPGGIYPSAGMAGSRPGGPIAAAWALLNYLGEDGYLEITDIVMRTAKIFQDGINAIPGLKVLSNPEMSVFAIASDSMDVYELADELALRGWHLDRQIFPPSLHVTVNYVHAQAAADFLTDLANAAERVSRPGLRKTATKFLVKAANLLTRVLPEETVSNLMNKASSLLGGGSGLPSRMAPMYGLIGSLPNRGDLKELVLDLLDNINTYKE